MRLAFRESYDEPFTLVGGMKSPYYVDGKGLLLDPLGSKAFIDWLYPKLREIKPRPVAIGGMEVGSIPIACLAMAMALEEDLQLLQAFVVRKQSKPHGTELKVEGHLNSGDHVVIVDDVITTGRSTIKAIKAVEEVGCTVERIYCIVDREEARADGFAAYESRMESAFTLAELQKRRIEGLISASGAEKNETSD